MNRAARLQIAGAAPQFVEEVLDEAKQAIAALRHSARRARPIPFVAPRTTTFAGRFTIQRAAPIARFEFVARDPLAPDSEKGVKAWFHRSKVLGAGQGVLRQVDAPTLRDDDLVQRVDERLSVVATHGQVDGNRDSRAREREQPDALGTAILDPRSETTHHHAA